MQDTSLTNSPDRPYHSFLDATKARFQAVVGPLFVAEVPDLWPIHLNECIRGELHGVRSVIEAFSETGKLDACDGQVAAGLAVSEPFDIRAAGTQYNIMGLE